MPRIPTFQSNPTLPQPIATGEAFGAAAARGDAAIGGALQGFGGSVSRLGGVLQERKTQGELSQISAKITEAQAALTNEWRETLRTADPNDTEVAQRFMSERVRPTLEQVSQLATTREAQDFFTRASAGLSAGFSTTTTAGQVSLAETAAVVNFEQSINNLSDATAADPLSFETNLGMLDILADGFQRSGGLSTDTRLKLVADQKRLLARSAARGLIEQSPQAAREIIDAGSFSEFLTGDDRATLINQADTAIAAQEAARRKALGDAAAQARTEYLDAAVNDDGSINSGNLPAILNAITKDPRLASGVGAADQAAIFNMVRTLAEQDGSEKTSNPSVVNQLLRRAAAGDLTATEAMTFVGSGIDFSDLNNQIIPTILRAASPDGRGETERINNHLDAIKTQLGISGNPMFEPAPRASKALQKYTDWFYKEYNRLRDEGKSVDSLLNINSPDFLGAQLGQFITPLVKGEFDPSSLSTETLDPEFRRVQFAPAPEFRDSNTGAVRPAGRIRSPEELDKLLEGG